MKKSKAYDNITNYQNINIMHLNAHILVKEYKHFLKLIIIGLINFYFIDRWITL